MSGHPSTAYGPWDGPTENELRIRDLEEALNDIFGMAASYLNICPDRHGQSKAKLVRARKILEEAGYQS